MLTDNERPMLNVAISHLTAIADGSAGQHGAEQMRAAIALDALRAIAAPQPATVGELLATAPHNSEVRWTAIGGESMRYQIDAIGFGRCAFLQRGTWRIAYLGHDDLNQPATRGPIEVP
jgi:hypothetical protein